MKAIVKKFGFYALAGSGLPILTRAAFHRCDLAILMYHGIVRGPLPVADWCFLERDLFARQIDLLRRRFEVLPLDEAVVRLRGGLLERPTAVITFDDGYRSVHELALPLLRQAALPATIFLNVGLIDGDRTVWFCRLLHALTRTRRAELDWNGARYGLESPVARARASHLLQGLLKPLAQPGLLQALDDIEHRLDVPVDPAFEPESPFRMLDRPALGALQASGLFTFGAHTESHAILAHLPEPDQRREIETSLQTVAALTNRPCSLFSFPNGRAEDYDGRALEILRDCGVSIAVTSIEGPNRPTTPALELRRYGIGADMSLDDFLLTVYHAKFGLRRLLG